MLIEGDVVPPLVGLALQLIEEAVDDLPAQDCLFHDLLAVLCLDMGVEDIQRLDIHQGADLAETVAAALFQVNAFGTGLFFQLHTHLQAPLLAGVLQTLVYLHGTAGDAAGAGADQNIGDLPALVQKRAGLCLQSVEPVSRQNTHLASSSLRMDSKRARAESGVILAWTSPSSVSTGDRPQAPRHATVSRVKRPSASVLRLPVSCR